jgi:hypothetical protein
MLKHCVTEPGVALRPFLGRPRWTDTVKRITGQPATTLGELLAEYAFVFRQAPDRRRPLTPVAAFSPRGTAFPLRGASH